MTTKLPALKNIPPKTDRELKLALDSIKEALEVRLGRRGDPLDRAVTLRELSDSGIVKIKNKGTQSSDIVPPQEEVPGGNLTIPPAPTALVASSAFTAVILDWNEAPYNNHAYTEVWRSQDNNLGGAVRIATTNAFVYTDEVGYGTTHYYWVRFVSTSNIEGPFNGTEGQEATTVADIGAVMTSLSEELKQMPGFNTLLSDIDVTINANTLNLQQTLEAINTAASNAQTAVNSLNTNTPRVIRSTSAPTARPDNSTLQAGDIWIDTDSSPNVNEIFVYTGSTWAASTSGSTSSSDTTLQTQITANGNSITQNANNILLVAGVSDEADISTSVNITSLNSSITNANTNIGANASAIGGLTTRVTAAEGTISSHTSDITSLESTLSGYSGSNTVATAVSGLQTQITSNDTDIADANTAIATKASAASVTSLSTSLNNLSGTVDGKTKTFAQDNAPTATAIGDLWIDTNDGNKLYRAESVGADEVASGEWVTVRDTGFVTNANAISTLTTTVTNLTNGAVASNSAAITSLQNALSGFTGSGAVSSALSTLTSSVNANDTDIATNATNISSAQTAITNLQGTVNTISGDYATGSALTSLTNTVNAIDVLATFAQDNAPTSGMGTGDIWLDTNDDNKLYRWDGSAWVALQPGAAALSANSSAITSLQNALSGFTGSGAVSSAISGLQNSVSNNAGNITANADSITDLESTVNNATTGVTATANALSQLTTNVNSIPVQFFQANAPSSGHVLGDYWIDSDDNQLYRYDGSAWVAIRDSLVTSTASSVSQLQTDVADNTADISTNATAISNETQARTSAINQLSATAAAKNKTFVGTSAPTALAEGDLWIDTDDNNKLYRATAAGNSNWVVVRDDSNDAKATVFAQPNTPTALAAGDIWIDTNDDDKVYRATAPGTSNWVPVGVASSASVTTLSTAVSDIEGNAAASHVLQVSANGSVAGMVLEANASDGGSASAVQFIADKFAIWNDNDAGTAPFTVNNSTVFMKNAMIQDAAINTARIANLAVQEAKIDNLAVTTAKIANVAITTAKIQDAAIERAKIKDLAVDDAKIDNLNAGKINAGFIDAARIDANTITADMINTANLSLPVVHKTVSGAAIGTFNNNTMRVKRVGEIGTEPGLYSGFVRIKGGTGQVKTLEVAAGDGTFGAGSSFDIENNIEYDSGSLDGSTNQLPLADTGKMQYVSGASKYWSRVDRFRFTHSIAQISFQFRKRSSNSTTAYLYVNAQGNGNNRSLSSVEYAFTRLGINEPDAFSFTDLTGQNTSTVFTSNTITLSGTQFVSGVATLTDNAGGTAQFKVNSGSYQTGTATVVPGDTITVRLTSASTVGTTRSANIDVNGINNLFIVQT
tara:strand:+ start:4119 stop:8192 length:4074 start_codon:yes stop_codon:yes gene_type:complete